MGRLFPGAIALALALLLLCGTISGCGSVGVGADHQADAGTVLDGTGVDDTGNDDAPATTDGGVDAPGVTTTWDSTTALWDQARWN